MTFQFLCTGSSVQEGELGSEFFFTSLPLIIFAGCSEDSCRAHPLVSFLCGSTGLCCLLSYVKIVASYISILTVGSKRIVLVSSYRRQLFFSFFFFYHSWILFFFLINVVFCFAQGYICFGLHHILKREGPSPAFFAAGLTCSEESGHFSSVTLLTLLLLWSSLFLSSLHRKILCYLFSCVLILAHMV